MNKIYLLPGMGATSEMYKNCRFPDRVELINWIPEKRGMSLRLYAQAIARHYGIVAGDSVGGSSFGGMVGSAIMGIVGCKKLILIGSCVSPGHIQPFIQKSASLGSVLPFNWGLSISGFPSMPFLSRMAHGQGNFMNWACGALVNWPGEKVELTKISHIHGDKDFIIPISRVKPNWIEKGCGHLVAMERPGPLSDFMARQ